MSAQTNFNIENMIGRHPTSQQVFQEFSHVCRKEYTVTRALCMNCLCIEESRFTSRNPIPINCTCEEIPPYVSEQCIHCAAIKEEITFLKNEIRRISTMYGIEVAETLEMNPLFLQTIEKLVFRVQLLEQVILRQLIRTETAERNDRDDDVSMSEDSTIVDDNNDEDAMDTLSYDGNPSPDNHRTPTFVPHSGVLPDDEDNNDEDAMDADDEDDNEQPDTDDDAEIDSITRNMNKIDITETESLDNGNRKRKRPESPELWLYDGSMV